MKPRLPPRWVKQAAWFTHRGAERDRLWARWREIDENLDAYAARRPTAAVVVLEPRAPAEPGP